MPASRSPRAPRQAAPALPGAAPAGEPAVAGSEITAVEVAGATGTCHVGRVAAWLAKEVELGLEEVGLSLPQYRVLWVLDAGPSLPSALAERLAVRPPSVTAVVDGLVARGLVERHHRQEDRRQVTHTLTAAGRRALAGADGSVDGRLADIAACLPDPAEARRAMADVALWQRALLAHRERTVAARR